MTSPARADAQALPACAHETTSPRPNPIENVAAAAGRAPVTSSRRGFLMNTVVCVASLASAALLNLSLAESLAPSESLLRLRGIGPRR